MAQTGPKSANIALQSNVVGFRAKSGQRCPACVEPPHRIDLADFDKPGTASTETGPMLEQAGRHSSNYMQTREECSSNARGSSTPSPPPSPMLGMSAESVIEFEVVLSWKCRSEEVLLKDPQPEAPPTLDPGTLGSGGAYTMAGTHDPGGFCARLDLCGAADEPSSADYSPAPRLPQPPPTIGNTSVAIVVTRGSDHG